MDWINQFRKDLFFKLEETMGNFEVQKNNPDFKLTLAHSYTFDAQQAINDFKLNNKEFLQQMKFDITEEIPGIDKTQLLDSFRNNMHDYLQRIGIMDETLPLRIFITCYFALFEKYVIELKN